MKKQPRAIVFVLCLAMIFAAFPAMASAESVRPVEKEEPAAGHVMIKVNTQALTTDKQKMLDRMNAIRKEACDEGVEIKKSSGTTRKLSASDYTPLTWSAEMEQVALTRAVEANLCMGHMRPNSDDGSQNWSTASYNGFTPYSEILAWGMGIKYDGTKQDWVLDQDKAMMDSIEAWYKEKENLKNPGSVAGGETGHYFAIINPDHQSVGMAGAYAVKTTYETSVAGEFLSKYTPSQDATQIGKNGEFLQMVEVQKSKLDNVSIKSEDALECGEEATLSLNAETVSYTSSLGTSRYNNVQILKPVEWTCDDDGILTIDESGNVKAMAPGTSTVTATVDGTTYTKELTVKMPTPAPAPKTLNASLTKYNAVKISWAKVPEATGYMVYYRAATASKYTQLTKTTATSCSKSGLTAGKKYTVKVVPYKEVGDDLYLSSKYKTTSFYTLKQVATPKVTKASKSSVKVSWSNISGESGYQISKSSKKNGTYVVATYKTTTGKYKKVKATRGKTYYYKVRAYKTVNGKNVYAPWSKVKAYKIK